MPHSVKLVAAVLVMLLAIATANAADVHVGLDDVCAPGRAAPAKIIIYSNGAPHSEEPPTCIGNPPPRTLTEAATKAGFQVERLCGTWRGDRDGAKGSYIYQRAEQFKAAVADCVARGVPRSRIVLAGHSAGGWSALMAMSQEPGLAHSAILFAPACCGRSDQPDRPTWRRIQAQQERQITGGAELRALVFGYDYDEYNRTSELAFLPQHFGATVQLDGYSCRFWTHLTAFHDCRSGQTTARIAEYLKE